MHMENLDNEYAKIIDAVLPSMDGWDAITLVSKAFYLGKAIGLTEAQKEFNKESKLVDPNKFVGILIKSNIDTYKNR